MSGYEHGSEELTEGQTKYYTPTTEQIRKGLLTGYVSDSEFDRWFAEVIRTAKADGFDEGWDARVNAETITPTENPYRQGENK